MCEYDNLDSRKNCKSGFLQNYSQIPRFSAVKIAWCALYIIKILLFILYLKWGVHYTRINVVFKISLTYFYFGRDFLTIQ